MASALRSVFIGFKYLFRRPYTRQVPDKEPPFKTERTRGRHILYIEKCVGCSMCQIVCPADAIDMVKLEGEWKQNRKKIFPAIDIHRCTFCGLCVEICPTGALVMTDVTGGDLVTLDKDADPRTYDPYSLREIKEVPKYRVTLTKSIWTPRPPMWRPRPPPKKVGAQQRGKG